MSGVIIDLVRRSDNALVEAQLIDTVQAQDLILVERASWGPVRAQLLGKLRAANVPGEKWPQSLHWDWSRKAPELGLLEVSGFAILCQDHWQGIMLTKSASGFARLAEDKGRPLIYVDYVEAAPWNWTLPPIGQKGQYRGAGSLLIRRAVQQSLDEGFHGRIGLHALPQAERFYEAECGMTPIARDAKKQDLLYFEFSRGQAHKFLGQGGD